MKDWEKEFDEKFCVEICWSIERGCYGMVLKKGATRNSIKAFIRKLLEEEREVIMYYKQKLIAGNIKVTKSQCADELEVIPDHLRSEYIDNLIKKWRVK